MNIPNLNVAKAAVWFYHAHIVNHEAKVEELAGLAVELDTGYALSEHQARAVFQLALS